MSPDKVHKVHKRNRKYAVCTECRIKKIKCDRGNPCSNCKRSDLQCTYIAPKGKQMIAVPVRVDETPANESVGNANYDVLSQINQLKAQMEELKSQKEDRYTRSSIVNEKLPGLKRTAMLRKSSRTVFLGPTSQFSFLFFKARKYPGSMLRTFRTTLSESRRAYKKEHPKHTNLGILSDKAASEEDVIRQINLLLVPDIAAMQERLLYMQDHLSILLYRGFMPMDIVFRSFFQFFPSGAGPFEKPKKPYLFVDLALITALIFTVIIFTRYSNSPTAKFSHPMTCESDALINLSVQLLNYSDFRRKRTQQAVLTLLVLKDALCNLDNAEGANGPANAYPLFQLALDNAYQMGLHRDLRGNPYNYTILFKDAATYRSRVMTPLQEKILWNFLISEDARYSALNGTKLLVDYNYCDKFYVDPHSTMCMANREKAVQILRDTCTKMNSVHDISIRDTLGSIDELLSYTRIIPMDMFKNEVSAGLPQNELVVYFETKLTVLQLVQCLCGSVLTAIEDIMNRHSPSESDKEELRPIIKQAYERMVIIGSLMAQHIHYLCDGQTIFETEPDGMHIVYFKRLLTSALTQSMRIAGLEILTNEAQAVTKRVESLHGKSTYEYIPDEDIVPWEGEITPRLLETVLYDQSTNISASVAKRLVSLEEFIRFAYPLYNALAKHRCIRESMDSFMALKFIITIMSLMQAIQENRELFSGDNVMPARLLEIAKEKLSQFNEGVVDVTLQLNVEQEDLETLWNTWFNDQEPYQNSTDQVLQDMMLFGDAGPTDDIDRIPINF